MKEFFNLIIYLILACGFGCEALAQTNTLTLDANRLRGAKVGESLSYAQFFEKRVPNDFIGTGGLTSTASWVISGQKSFLSANTTAGNTDRFYFKPCVATGRFDFRNSPMRAYFDIEVPTTTAGNHYRAAIYSSSNEQISESVFITATQATNSPVAPNRVTYSIPFNCGEMVSDGRFVVEKLNTDGVRYSLDNFFVVKEDQIGSAAPMQALTNFVPNASVNQGIGTLTISNANDCQFFTDNGWMTIDCKAQVGTTAGSEARLAIPDNFTIGGGHAGVRWAGCVQNNNTGNLSGGCPISILYENNVKYLTFSYRDTGQNGLTKQTGTGAFNSNTIYTFKASFPIQNQGPVTTTGDSTLPQSWSGYHDTTCSWARTNTAYGDPAADATCALVQRTNNNFGTVTTVAGALPGIIFTPKQPATYEICATISIEGSSTGAGIAAQMVDGSGAELIVGARATGATSNTNVQPLILCADLIVQAAGSAQTVKLLTKATSGSVMIGGSGGSNGIEWKIKPISKGVGLFVPGIVKGPGVTAQVEHFSFRYGTGAAQTVCSASPCSFLSQLGDAVNSVTRTGAGAYTANFKKAYSNIICSSGGGSTGGVSTFSMYFSAFTPGASSLSFQTSQEGTASRDTYGTVNCDGIPAN